jgi:ubiquinone/menaquinone biosynthesis C-methylase UbiE
VTDQRARITGVFDRAAATYDQVGVDFFKPIAARLVDALAPRPGERILDVGCGGGAALLPLGRATGPAGSVTGIDLSPAMVEVARAAAQQAGLTADVRVGDASEPDLPAASYDVVCASLVLFFLPDPLAALRKWRELLVEGGRLGISTFGAYTSEFKEVDAVFAPYLPPAMRDARTTGKAGPFSSDEGVEQLMAEAGLTDLRTVRSSISVRFADQDHWYRWSWSTGQRGMWELVPPDELEAVRAAAYAALEGCRDADGRIGFDQDVRLTLGVR